MKTLLFDGNNLAYRCKYTFSLSNNGADVSITYGFLRVMDSLLSKYKPSSVVVCFDGGIPNFRRQAVPEYKANRHKFSTPEEFIEYKDFLRQLQELEDYILPMSGVICVRKDGIEADDLLYHASRLIVGDCLIITTDMDLLQAINHKVAVYNPYRDIVYNDKIVEEELGVSVAQIVDWRALQGDSSDNIPGVYGIGQKTATKLFQEYGSLTAIVNAALRLHPTKHIEGKLRDNITAFGIQRLFNNVFVTSLYADRVGAKMAVVEAVKNFSMADKLRIKKYFMNNAFVSLMEGNYYQNVMKLSAPELDLSNVRIPIVYPKDRKHV